MISRVTLAPMSNEARWLIKLTINGKKNRLVSCAKKISWLAIQTQQGQVGALLALYRWYVVMRELERYFDKEIVRLTKRLRNKSHAPVQYFATSVDGITLPVTTPVAATLHRLLRKFDTLMCLQSSCIAWGIIGKRRVVAKKTQRYQKELLRLVHTMAQYKPSRRELLLAHQWQCLSEDDKTILPLALQSDITPLLPNVIFRQLNQLIRQPINVVTPQATHLLAEKSEIMARQA